VWKPFAAAPTPPWWQHVPQWALAAAAGIVLVSGAAGGAVTHAFMPHAAPVVQAAPAGATQVSAPAEVAAMQQQIAMLRAELSQLNGRVQQASVSAVTPAMEAALHKTFDSQLSDLRMPERQTDGSGAEPLRRHVQLQESDQSSSGWTAIECGRTGGCGRSALREVSSDRQR
jgi:hypothetical protein